MTTKIRERDDAVIARAVRVLERRLYNPQAAYQVNSPNTMGEYARLRLGGLEREAFFAFYLDVQHRPIAHEQLFTGGLSSVEVDKREVARAALLHNAAAVVIVHNHPGGEARFSDADRTLTRDLREALALIGIVLLDHLLVAGAKVASYEAGEIPLIVPRRVWKGRLRVAAHRLQGGVSHEAERGRLGEQA